MKQNLIITLLCVITNLTFAQGITTNQSADELFVNFPWLSTIINDTNCQSGNKVELYKTGIFNYLIVEMNNERIMYNSEGRYYCADRENFSCTQVYNLGTPIDIWNCDKEEDPDPQPEDKDEIFSNFPWLSPIVNPNDCENEAMVELYQSGIFQYLVVTRYGQKTMYNAEGIRYCADRENFSCIEVYGLEGPIDSWICDLTNPDEPEPSSPIFDDYTWLSNYVDLLNCRVGQSVELYNQVGYSFLIVDNFGIRTMYYQDGTYYCQDRPNFSCREVYGLGNPDEIWNCGDTVEPSICEYNNPLTDLPWIANFISGDPPFPQIISTHNYNGELVFVRAVQAVGAGYTVYNCQGGELCNFSIFGALDECPDFSFTDTFIENIYDNNCSLTDPLQLDWIKEIITKTPTDECDTHSIDMFQYAGNNYFILNWGDDCTLATPGGGFNIIDCRGDVYCTTIANVTCEDEIAPAYQSRVEIWSYEPPACEYGDNITDLPWLADLISEDPTVKLTISTHNYNGETVLVLQENLRPIIQINPKFDVYNCEGQQLCDKDLGVNYLCNDFNFENTLIAFVFDNRCEIDDPLQLDWIKDITNKTPLNECATNIIEMFEYEGCSYFVLNPSEDCTLASPNPRSNILDYRGDVYCATAGNDDEICEDEISTAFQSRVEIWRYESPIEVDDPIFEQYSWLNSVINPSNCEEYISIKVYDLGSFAYVFVETQSGGVLYFEDGTRYCSSSDSRNCEMLYNLTNPTSVFNCEGSITPDYTFTICTGESVELKSNSIFELLDCSCPPPCPPRDLFPGPPQVEWSPQVECNEPVACRNITVSPTETTLYTSVVEDIRVGIAGCYPLGFDPDEKTFTTTTFLVIVDDEGCGSAKHSLKRKDNLNIAPEINVYPNPTIDVINIDLPEVKNSQSTLTLKNTNGQTLQHLKLQPTVENRQQFDLSNYATGIYLLEYFNGETITVEKIIKR